MNFPEWVGGLIAAVALGVFADYIRMKVVITRIEWQLSRIASDRESEKETVARRHEDFEIRLRKLELNR